MSKQSDALSTVFLTALVAGAAAVAALSIGQQSRPKGSAPASLVADPLAHIVGGGDPAIGWARSGGMMPGNPDPGAAGRREPPGVLG